MNGAAGTTGGVDVQQQLAVRVQHQPTMLCIFQHTIMDCMLALVLHSDGGGGDTVYLVCMMIKHRSLCIHYFLSSCGRGHSFVLKDAIWATEWVHLGPGFK